MKIMLNLIALTAVVGLLSCKTAEERKSKKADETLPKAELVPNFDAYQNSAFCTITSVAIEGNTIKIGVEYSGGCEKHAFKLLGSEMIQKSLPPQRGVMLWHDNNGDSCRGIVNEDLIFDISVLAYEGGEIMLNISGWDTPVSYTQVK